MSQLHQKIETNPSLTYVTSLTVTDVSSQNYATMKHASEQSLDQLEAVLERIRRRPELTEKKRGIFYRRSAAFLHFHEDADGLFADLKVDGEWQRLAVNSGAERKDFLQAVQSALE